MVLVSNELTEILNEIGDELINQISSAKNIDEKIDPKKLSQQSKILNEQIIASKITEENKSTLRSFSLTLQDSSTVRKLHYEKQELVRILSNLNDLWNIAK